MKQWNGGTLTCKEMFVTELCEQINMEMLRYVRHIYDLKHQSKAFREEKESLSEGSMILHRFCRELCHKTPE